MGVKNGTRKKIKKMIVKKSCECLRPYAGNRGGSLKNPPGRAPAGPTPYAHAPRARGTVADTMVFRENINFYI